MRRFNMYIFIYHSVCHTCSLFLINRFACWNKTRRFIGPASMPTSGPTDFDGGIGRKSQPLSSYQSAWIIINPFLKNINLWPSYIPTAEIDVAIDYGTIFRR